MVKKINSFTSVRYNDRTKTTSQSFLETGKKALCSRLTIAVNWVAQCIAESPNYFQAKNTKKLVATVPKKKVNNLQISEDLITQFWKKHIESFTIFHTTSSWYSQHFEKYGISSVYPEELIRTVPKMKAIWINHQGDGTFKSNAFQDFAAWYDMVVRRGRIEIAFSARQDRIRTFTTGGGWINQIRHFLSACEGRPKAFSFEEHLILKQMRYLLFAIDEVPSMTIKIHGGSPAFAAAQGIYSSKILSCSLKEFIQHVKKESSKWQHINELSGYLDQIKLNLENDQQWLKTNDVVLSGAVNPEDLEFVYNNSFVRE